MYIFIILIIAAVLGWRIYSEKKKEKEYQQTSYFQSTHIPYRTMLKDTGRVGEYYTYLELKEFEQKGAKLLYNVYLPKVNGETTEIDLMMISANGIFVFESKNYSGWIFGNESGKTWTQTLTKGRGKGSQKEHFLNPIIQNKGHIAALKRVIGDDMPIYSIVVFSERCELKDVSFKSDGVTVIKRNQTKSAVNSFVALHEPFNATQSEIDRIYNTLFSYSQVDESVKQQHIENINRNKNSSAAVAAPFAAAVEAKETNLSAKKNVSSEIPAPPPCKKADSNITDNTETEAAVESTVSDVLPEAADAGQNTEIKAEPVSENNLPENNRNDVTDNNAEPVLICPKCSGRLILRTAKRGNNAGQKFYGCENYPKCNYIQNIDSESK